jgi:hypothetical protein
LRKPVKGFYMPTIRKQFSDLAVYSDTARTAVSIRDGVLEYLGAELGLEPLDRVFTVYRSPATIANAAYLMPGIPLTDGHVSMDGPAVESGSRVESSVVIDQIDEPTHSRLAVQNKLAVSDELQILLKDKHQLSLGYEADLVPHSRFDFEQIDIQPHHLAAVPAGRCGPLCSFLDRKPDIPHKPLEGDTMKPKKIHKAFTDAEGSVSLDMIVEIATGLPEAIRKVPVDQLVKLMPAMQEIMSYAKEQNIMPAEEDVADEDMEMEDVDMEDMDKDMEDADMEEKDMKDMNGKENFADSTQFKDAVASAVKGQVRLYSEVVNKARDFVDADYNFVGKSAHTVMRDSLATQSADKFEDSELPVAFKLLRKASSDYTQFGDTKADSGLMSRISDTLGEK